MGEIRAYFSFMQCSFLLEVVINQQGTLKPPETVFMRLRDTPLPSLSPPSLPAGQAGPSWSRHSGAYACLAASGPHDRPQWPFGPYGGTRRPEMCEVMDEAMVALKPSDCLERGVPSAIQAACAVGRVCPHAFAGGWVGPACIWWSLSTAISFFNLTAFCLPSHILLANNLPSPSPSLSSPFSLHPISVAALFVEVGKC